MRKCLRQPQEASRTRKVIACFAALLIGASAFQAVHAVPVPDFTLQLLNGKTTSLQKHRGTPVLINFFHST
jgi:cytochrome oxidase Cu insertion factor (SCO1/SenC/PrrC family)